MGSPSILHVDMDAFFVAVEVLDDPTLAGRPVVVGGEGARGVVAAASYEARAFGVFSAMSSAKARRLCPDAVFVAGRHHRYSEVSEAVFEVFRSFTPLVEGISLDEAFLDVAGARRLLGDGPAIAAQLRAKVAKAVGLSCSVGVAPRKLTAKLASEAAKPKASRAGPIAGTGVFVVELVDELAFLHAHPIRALWGVGPATETRLERLAVRTVGELAALPEAALVSALGQASGRHLHALAWARDHRPVEPNVAAKSIGHEETFASDRHTHAELARDLVRLADAVATRLRAAGVAGRTVQLKVRFADFRTITRSATVDEALDQGVALHREATRLLRGVDVGPGVRLIGVSVAGLGPPPAHQLELLDERPAGWWETAQAIDSIRSRFGAGAIGPATLAKPGRGLSTKRLGDQQWGPDATNPDPSDSSP